MKATKRLGPGLALAALLALTATPAPAAQPVLGQVDFANSGSPAAQESFQRGVAALHSFWYDEAADAFREAQKADAGFVLAYWGEALTYDHPLWGQQDLEAARKALARLAPTPQERTAKAPTAREKGFLEAVEALYGEGEKKERARAYTEAMRRLHERFPDDTEVAAFYSLSLIAPALVGGVEPELRVGTLMRAAGILEDLFDRHPRHPGVLHYLIHAYDDPEHAPLGLRAARTYAEVAPAAHHALHMPSHIFVQLGQWDRAAASNEDAWAASEAWVQRRQLSPDKRDFHSLSWLAYVYLQQGRIGKAREVLGQARRAARESESVLVQGAAREIEARYLIDTWSWSQVAAKSLEKLKPEAGHGHCGKGYPMPGTGALLLANGIGAARAAVGEPDKNAVYLPFADRSLAQLKEEAAASDERAGRVYRVLEKEVEGMILLARGKTDEALKLLAEAAELESALPPPSGPPDTLKPAHEVYGEVLLNLGRHEEAARQFEKSLLRTPNRAASLLGAARAAAKTGNGEVARQRYAALAEVWKQADPELPQLKEIRAYLNQAPAR